MRLTIWATKCICALLLAFSSWFGLSAKNPVSDTSASLEVSVLERVREEFVRASVLSYADDPQIINEFIECSDFGKANDTMLLQLYMAVHLPDSEVDRLLGLFDFREGCFGDIDYSSGERGRWPATLHVTRMYALAKIYKDGNDAWRGSEELKSLLHAGMAYWFRTMPKCPNWWHNDIGVPKKMTAILLMMRDELSDDEIDGGLRVLESSGFGLTGQNKVWLAGNNLMKGLLIDDEDLVLRARGIIAEEICVTDDEGVQDDWSYHQHGPQNQMGNYGLAYAEGMSFWFRVLAGTKFMFDEGRIRIISNFVKEGLCWTVCRGIMDPNFCGRQVFLNAGRGKVLSLAVIARNMAEVMRREALAEDGSVFCGDVGSDSGLSDKGDHLLQEARFYDRVADECLYRLDMEDGTAGAKYFPRSDCGTYRADGWHSSVRMHSERTIGFEFTNTENTLGNFSADGAVLLMQDGDEYENIFACWDWRKVPGVTAYNDGKPIKCDDSLQGKRNMTEHVAGAVAETSAGTVMVASMELNRDGLHAFKSTFFFEGRIFALGSDIYTSNPDFKEVTTSVDQNHLRGKVSFGDAAADFAEANDLTDTIRVGVKWIHHNNRGYVSLDGVGMNLSGAVQRGKWDCIEPSFKDEWDEKPVFKCWFDHPLESLSNGRAGSYEYAILPCASVDETIDFERGVSNGESPVLMNTAECQAVSQDGVICAVVHKAGVYEIGGETFEVDRPCVLVDDGDDLTVEYFPEGVESIAARVFGRAAVQFRILDRNVSNAETLMSDGGAVGLVGKAFPRTLGSDGNLEISDYRWWCSGFYPGCLWIMYERTGDEEWRDLALKYTLALDVLRYRTDDHDIGFQLMSSYGKALRLTGNKEFEDVLRDGAASLATRFNPVVGCTKSWDGDRWAFPVIIDNMMNLELLFTGSVLNGDDSLKEMAVRHAETTMRNHFREDCSTWHLVDYDPEDGHVLGKQTVQGYSDGSAWSRGQSWALYGFTMVYRFTRDVRFLYRAIDIAQYLLPRLPEDGIPYWDYCAPDIPNDFRDASAGAIMASALIELSGYVDAEKASRYQAVARKILRTLASEEYLADEGEIQGFLLKHSVGNKPGDSEVDVPLTYTDYYFLEALVRYLSL